MSATWQWAKANPDAAARRIRELERENTALKKSILNAEVLAEYDPAHGHNDLWSGGCWLRSGQQIMIIDRAAIDAARKEAQP